MMDSLSLSRVTSNDDETDMLIPRRNFHTKKKEEKKIIQPKRNGVTPTGYENETNSSHTMLRLDATTKKRYDGKLFK